MLEKNLEKSTIFLVLSGSRAYGLEDENSDWDYRGVCLPPLKSYFVLPHFEQFVDQKEKKLWKNYPQIKQESEMQVMELTKFFYLALGNNPAALEILFTDPKFFIIKHPLFDNLLNVRKEFLSRKSIYTYCSYAHSQLELMKRHKKWLDDPPKYAPTRADFGLNSEISLDQLGAAQTLIDREVQKIMMKDLGLNEGQQFELNSQLKQSLAYFWEAMGLNKIDFPIGEKKKFTSTKEVLQDLVAKKLGMEDNFLQILNAEKRYQAAHKNWKSYQVWLKERNLRRAILEVKLGYDPKAASHCIRLLRTGMEILERKDIQVYREDREELKAIKRGAWTYEQIIESVEKQKEKLNYLESDLPREPNKIKLEKIISEMIGNYYQINFLSTGEKE